MTPVLLVDDDADGLELRALILGQHGYDCAKAARANDALRLLFQTNPVAVVLDLRLPEAADGLALIRAIHQANPETRIIVLSGYPEDLAGAPEAALVFKALSKPVRGQTLLSALRADPKFD